jgi:hypothetical protein
MTRMSHRFVSLVLAVALAAGAAALLPSREARAANVIVKQDGVHKQWDLAVMLHALWWGGVGVGGRLGIPVGPKGFIPAINDQVKIELGFSYQHWWMRSGYCHPHDPDWDWCRAGYEFDRFAFPLLFRWDFFILKMLTVYFTIGIEFGFIPQREVWENRVYYYGLVVFAGSLGLLVNFHENVSLRAEFGHQAFNIGVEFRL